MRNVSDKAINHTRVPKELRNVSDKAINHTRVPKQLRNVSDKARNHTRVPKQQTAKSKHKIFRKEVSKFVLKIFYPVRIY